MDELDQPEMAEITPGGDVAYGESPFIAAVFNSLVKYQTCTGFIVHRQYVVSAGYCVMQGNEVVNPMFVSVLSGVVDFREHEMDQWRYAVLISPLAKTYKDRSILVLIKLSEPFFVDFSCGVIRHRHDVFTNETTCTAVSWRFQDAFNRVILKSLVLKKYTVYVMNKKNCLDVYKLNPILSGLENLEFVCVTYRELSHDMDCVGADGSSVFCVVDGVPVPVGIAVNYFGESKCNRFDVPNVFLDLGGYSLWMDHVMRSEGDPFYRHLHG